MAARGLSDFRSFSEFSEFSLKDLRDPMALADMDRAVERLIVARETGEKICLYADYDMDGTPGLALLIRGLQLCGFQHLLSFQPNRFDDGYGVHPEIVADFVQNHGISLFVTVDVGITDVKAVEVAQSRGADFIVTDHHQPKEELPPATAIVNPNGGHCDSGLHHLCGTGVAFYLVLALRRELKNRGSLGKDFDPKQLLDCFAIATLTDMVPLVCENRPLVRHGLLQLARTPRVGLQILLERLGLLGKGLSSSDVAIQLAPKLNALGRMNSGVQALDIFLVTDTQQANEFVDATLQAQAQRTEVQREAEVLLQQELTKSPPRGFSWQYGPDFHKGIVGLLATRVLQNHHVPSFVGAVLGDTIVGSARAPQGVSLLQALESCGECLSKFGGHHQAAGFELPLAQAERFRQSLFEHFQSVEQPKASVVYDLQADLAELNDQFRHWFKKLEPYGVGFPVPLIRLNHLFVASTKVLKDKHLKFVFKDIKGNQIDGLWFFAENIDELRQLTSKRVSVVVEPSINFYMGRESLQCFVRDLKVEY
jgi:single-stranded-DNA-specific exonuclease